MKIPNNILVMFAFIIFINCGERRENSYHSTENQKSIIKSDDVLKKYFSISDIPYLSKEEVDTILINEKKIKINKQYRNRFISKARARKSEIRNLIYSTSENNNVPYLFKRFLHTPELSNFNKDSIKDFVILYDLYKKRIETIDKVTKHKHFLSDNEIQKLIQSSFKDSIYYKELAESRFIKDSIKSLMRFNNIRDSLQSIIHPINSMLPFGPKPLGKLIENETNSLGFYVKRGDSLKDKQLSKRKDIYDIWMYYLKFHPHADVDLVEGYIEKFLPPIKTYEFVNLGNLEVLNEDENFDLKYSNFQLRLSNIGRYEIYYITAGIDSYDNDCNVNRKVDNCCFSKEGYSCNSSGFIVLYNRQEQHSKIIPVFKLQNSSYGFLLRFSYIKNNTIHVFEGKSLYNWFVDEKGDIDRYLHHLDGSTTSAKGYKSVGISKAYEIEIMNSGELKIKETKQ